MKNFQHIFFYIIVFLAASCNNTKQENVNTNKVPVKVITEKIAHVEMDIKGMTCEIGCAKIIESKVSKLQGVIFSKVNFEAKKGIFSYDENKISKDDIVSKISGIAGGDLYSITNTIMLDSLSN